MQVNSKNRIHLDSECNLEVKGTNNVIYVGKSVCNPLLSDQKCTIRSLTVMRVRQPMRIFLSWGSQCRIMAVIQILTAISRRRSIRQGVPTQM